MSGHIRNDKIQNDCIWEKVGVVSIEEKMIENSITIVWAYIKKTARGPNEKS